MKIPVSFNQARFSKVIGILLILFFLLFTGSLFAFRFNFTTVTDIVDNVKKEFAKIDTYKAEFFIKSEKLGRVKYQSGIIKYKASNKLYIVFHKPHGQKIVSNGKTLWIYIPSMNVVAEQDLKSNTGLFSTHTRSGLRRLFSKYHYRFASKDQPEQQPDGSKMYTLILKQKESRSGFRTIKLWITENYFVQRASGETTTGKKLDISFSNIKRGISLPGGLFKFKIPARARVIKNPMISEE